jgi:hypothetical protein
VARQGIGKAVTARGKQGHSFKPYDPNQQPPPSFYDPALDAAARAAARGYGYSQGDFQTANQRAIQDYTIGRQDVGTSYQRGVQDLATQKQGVDTGYQRGLSDLLTSRQRGTEDYTGNVSNLVRDYGMLANRQAQQQVGAGTSEGGALQAAMAKRQQNLAHDRAPLDTGYQRFQTDSGTQQQRMGEDYQRQIGAINTAYGRMGEDATKAYGAQDLSFNRGLADRTLADQRAAGELGFYQADTQAEKVAAAKAAGWTNVKPKNEHTGYVPGVGHTAYRDIGKGQILLPSGRIKRKYSFFQDQGG